MIGSGIFLLPASLALYGGISMIGWVLSSLGAVAMAIIFGSLGRRLPNLTGGPYAYTRAKLGDFPAFLVAWGYWISVWCAVAAIAVAFVGYLSIFIPVLSTNNTLAVGTGLVVIWGFTWINSRPLKTVGTVQLITTILKITPLLVVGVVGIFFIKPQHFSNFNLSTETNLSAIVSTTTLTFYAFLGVESVAIIGKNIKDPKKNIKRTTVTGTIITLIVYLLGSTAVMGILSPETLSQSSAPFADAAQVFLGNTAKYVIAIGAMVATLGALNGWILLQGQMPLSAFKDKLFPTFFGKVNKHESPILGVVISSILASIVMISNYTGSLAKAFTFMMMLSTLSTVIPFLFSCTSYGILLKGEKQNLWPRIGMLAFIIAFLLLVIAGSGKEVVFYGFILLMCGVPFYIFQKNQNGDSNL